MLLRGARWRRRDLSLSPRAADGVRLDTTAESIASDASGPIMRVNRTGRRHGVPSSPTEFTSGFRGRGPSQQLPQGRGRAQPDRQRGEPRRADARKLARRRAVPPRNAWASAHRRRRGLRTARQSGAHRAHRGDRPPSRPQGDGNPVGQRRADVRAQDPAAPARAVRDAISGHPGADRYLPAAGRPHA
jgi:hypothetical protein